MTGRLGGSFSLYVAGICLNRTGPEKTIISGDVSTKCGQKDARRGDAGRFGIPGRNPFLDSEQEPVDGRGPSLGRA